MMCLLQQKSPERKNEFSRQIQFQDAIIETDIHISILGDKKLKFNIHRSIILPVLTQALETCNTSAKFIDFLVEISKDNIRITSVNNYAQQSIEINTKVDVEEDTVVAFTIIGKNIVDFIRQCHDEELECTYSEKNHALKIASTTRKMHYVFMTGNAEEFQTITFQPGKQGFTIPGMDLCSAFEHTYPATNKENSQRPFTAVKLLVHHSQLTAESTDRNRIAIYDSEIGDTGIENFEVLIPREVADALSKIADNVEYVTIRPCNRHVVFEWDRTEFVTSLETDEQDEFIALREFFANPILASCRISREDFIRSMKLASLLDNDAEIYVTCSESGLELRTVENEVGAGIDTLSVKEVEGEATCCLPLKHLLKAVESCDEAWIKVNWSQLDNDEVGCGIEDGNGTVKFYVFPVRSKEYETED